MCGIIGYTGNAPAVPLLLEGLKTLEYRGYDSAGIAVLETDGTLRTVKKKGRLTCLADALEKMPPLGTTCGIGHTRWATHGEPSDRNSHPHATESLALVHNGIIENYATLAASLAAEGYDFLSDTDTEVAAKLIDSLYVRLCDPLDAILGAVAKMRGSFAFGVLFRDYPDTVFAIRRDSPLLVATGEEGSVIASDVPAILAHAREYVRLDEEVVAVLHKDRVDFFDKEKRPVVQKSERVDWSVEQAQKGGFPHFMLKEIYEEPDAIRRTVTPRIKNGLPYFDDPLLDTDRLGRFHAIHIVACGTAMHAGLVGKTLIERLARVPVTVEIASEFRYRDPILAEDDLVIIISQSGETADTLAALRHARSKEIKTLAVVNVIGSSIAREADNVLYTWAGPEIAVASTKAYMVQCAVLCLLAIRLSLIKGMMTEEDARALCRALLCEVPRAIEQVLGNRAPIERAASGLLSAEHLFFIGRGMDHSIAVEASLQLKEISYIHCEAYAAGELKHGTISLVTDGVPVIALLTQRGLCEKTVSGVREVSARGARVIAVCSKSLADAHAIPADDLLILPDVREELSVFPATAALQLLAYTVSASLGIDVDTPRNLAKSVTVE